MAVLSFSSPLQGRLYQGLTSDETNLRFGNGRRLEALGQRSASEYHLVPVGWLVTQAPVFGDGSGGCDKE